MSEAIAAFGTLLQIGDGATPEVFATIAEVGDIDGPGEEMEPIDASNQSSANAYMEFIAGLIDGGEVSFPINLIADDPTHDATTGLRAALHSRARRNFRLVQPDSTCLRFAALVTKIAPKSPVKDKLQAEITLKRSGPLYTLRDLITTWQNGGSPVYVSGHPSSEWNLINSFPLDSTTQTDPFTILERGHALRQTCLITSFDVNVYYLDPPGGGAWQFKLFFWNGSAYECKASQNFTPTGSGVVNNIQTFTLSPAIEADEGDIPALYLPVKHATVVGTDAARNAPAPCYVNAHIGVGESNAFTSEVTGGSQFVNILTKSHRPYSAWLGDSIVGSGNGVPDSVDQWRTDQENVSTYHTPGGSPGNQLCDLPYNLGLLLPDNWRHQSFSKGGSTFATMVVAGAELDRMVLADPAVVHIHCGVNDVAAGRAWSAVEADLDTIRAALPTQTLFLDEVLPYQGDDTTAAAVRNYNTHLATWCATNAATLIRCHDEMAVTRPSTGLLDDLKPLYSNGDSVHLSQAGVQKLAEIHKRYVY